MDALTKTIPSGQKSKKGEDRGETVLTAVHVYSYYVPSVRAFRIIFPFPKVRDFSLL